MLLELERSLSPAQRARLQSKLAAYAGELKALAATSRLRAEAPGWSRMAMHAFPE
jgi:hypothetical protein